mgnify:CR=1 FL=1
MRLRNYLEGGLVLKGEVFFHHDAVYLGGRRAPVRPLHKVLYGLRGALHLRIHRPVHLIPDEAAQAEGLSGHLGVFSKENSLDFAVDAEAIADARRHGAVLVETLEDASNPLPAAHTSGNHAILFAAAP